MRVLRAESTHVLAALSLLNILEPYVASENTTIQVHTDCKTLVNRLNMKHINKPSLVLGDHMDLIYQIRELAQSSKFKHEFFFTQAIKEAELDLRSSDEKLVKLIHAQAYGYFLQKGFVLSRQFSDFFPGTGISITANNKPLVSNIGMSMQNLERAKMREDYFQKRMNISTNSLSHVDTYTLGRDFSKTPKRQATYPKIIHRELNTMSVNERWSGSSDRCPVCLNCREDWKC